MARLQVAPRAPDVEPDTVVHETGDRTVARLEHRHVEVLGHAGELALRQILEDVGSERVHAREHQRLATSGRADRSHSNTVEPDAREAVVARRVPQEHRRDCTSRSHRRGQLGPGRELHRITVHEKEELLALEMRASLPEPAPGAENLRLERITDFASARVFRVEPPSEQFGVVMEVDDDLAHAGIDQGVDRPADERAIAERHERLRQRVGDRTKSRPEPRREHHRFHPDGYPSGGKIMFSGRSGRVRRCWR